MAFTNRDMYYGGYIYTGTPLWLGREKLSILPKINDAWHTVKAGDNADLIAHNYYNDSQLWWAICDANNISNPFDLSSLIGTNILIPALDNLEQDIENSRIITLKNYQAAERIPNLEPREGFSIGNINLKILEEGINQGQILVDSGRYHSEEFDDTHN
jgi:hypothetical protein